MGYDTSIPGAGIYGQNILQANTAYRNALTRLNAQRQSTLQQYGFAGTIDPSAAVDTSTGLANGSAGQVSGIHVDPNARYGAFQTMLKDAAAQGENMRDQLISRSLGKGGLAAQGEDQLKYDFGQNSLNLSNALTGALGSLQDQQNTAAYGNNQAVIDAMNQAAQNAPHNPAVDPTSPSTSGPLGGNDQRVTSQGVVDPWAVNLLNGGKSTGGKSKNLPVTDPVIRTAIAASRARNRSTKVKTKGRQL